MSHLFVEAVENGTLISNPISATGQKENWYHLSWRGIANSVFDGYNTAATGTDQWQTYAIDTSQWPNKIRWDRYYMAVDSASGTTYYFMFHWHETNNEPLTVNFAPIEEEREVAPETFLDFLERIGHDDDYLRIQDEKECELWAHIGQKPPWDPERVAKFEEKLTSFRERISETGKDLLRGRWGIEEFPTITPELLTQIERTSREFLSQWLSPEELKMYEESGHIKIPSPSEPEVHYIVRKGIHSRIERYEKGELVEDLCYISQWRGIPHDDVIAMRVFDLKFNEDQVLKVANHTRIRA